MLFYRGYFGKRKKKKLISHRKTKTFTVHTSTVPQLKADTSPKPSTPAITVISPICLGQ